MFGGVSRRQAQAVCGAMAAVVDHPAGAGRGLGQELVAAAADLLLGHPLPGGAPVPAVVAPDRLAAVTAGDPALSAGAAELIAVAALADGRVEPDRLRVALDYADALGVQASWTAQLADLAARRFDRALADMVRRNTATFPGLGDADGRPVLQPYTGRSDADQRLAASFEALEGFPRDSFGHAFWVHFRRHGFRFPGQPAAFNAAFAVPHDGLHVLSGYDTSLEGELMVSTFTGEMHRTDALAAHLLPVILEWHVGLEVNGIGTRRGGLDPWKFLVAWRRGHATTVDVLEPGWSFHDVAGRPLDDVRREYGIPALAAADRAIGPEVNMTSEADPDAA